MQNVDAILVDDDVVRGMLANRYRLPLRQGNTFSSTIKAGDFQLRFHV